MNVKVGVLSKEDLIDLMGRANKDIPESVIEALSKIINRSNEEANETKESSTSARVDSLLSDVVTIDKIIESTDKNLEEVISILLASKNKEIANGLEMIKPSEIDKSKKVHDEILAVINKHYPKHMSVADILSVNLAVGIAHLSTNELIIEASKDSKEMVNKIEKAMKCNCPNCVPNNISKSTRINDIGRFINQVNFDIERFTKNYKDGKVTDEHAAIAVYEGFITLETVSSYLGNDVASRVLSIASKWLNEGKK